MDVFGKLIQLCNLRGSLNVRCQASGDYFVDHTKSPPGEALFHIVLKGACLIEVEGAASPTVAHAGELVVFPQGAAHRLIHQSARNSAPSWQTRAPGLVAAEIPAPDEIAELDLLCGRFNYDPPTGALLFDSLPPAMHVRQDTGVEGLTLMAQLIGAEAQDPKLGAQEVVTALITALFIIALRQHFDASPIDRSMLAVLLDNSLAPSLLAMFSDPSASWSVESLASLCNMSRSTFARRYGAVAGKGPATVLLAVRCMLALKALRTTRLPTHEIASRVGYASEAAFCKAFTRQMGMTPSMARRSVSSYAS